MISKTKMLSLVKEFPWKQVERALTENPPLIAFRDKRGRNAAIRLLVARGAQLDPSVEDASPFLFAVQWSRFGAAEAFLKLGADVNFQNSKRMTALHCLRKKGADTKHIQMLLKYGARADLKDAKGVTAREILMRKRDPDLRKLAAHLA